ncbi:GH-E family nuclease [Lactiplantibacillus plantarum]|uniref:GH-E family nuclease n=1 Tax=Lactiplantibacillus plantarum TaxID=1590 RepID=UPI0027DEA67C|nr:GH-E family nuclease [Lactiplantibacillus plantarum]
MSFYRYLVQNQLAPRVGLYKNRKMTLKELKDFQFNPKNYRLETPSANRSHKYETR